MGKEAADIAGTSGVVWLIDPIDGTTNFVYGIPGFNVSIAAQVDGRSVAGVVVDPLHDDVFTATLGGGATRNGGPIRCSERDRPGHRPGRHRLRLRPPTAGRARPRCSPACCPSARHPPGRRRRPRPVLGGLRSARRLLRGGAEALGLRRRALIATEAGATGDLRPGPAGRPDLTVAAAARPVRRPARAWWSAVPRHERAGLRYHEQPWEPAS